jgi:hypothetical protein
MAQKTHSQLRILQLTTNQPGRTDRKLAQKKRGGNRSWPLVGLSAVADMPMERTALSTRPVTDLSNKKIIC